MPIKTKEEAAQANKDTKRYEKYLRNFNSTMNSMVMYPPGHPITDRQIKNFLQETNEFAKTEKLIAIHLGEGVLVINDIHLPSGNATMEKIGQKFKDFKITDLEISEGVTEEEIKSFLDIFAHSDESSKMYSELNDACQKNQITHIRALQAAYIRVPKDVKDKLGGKTVGEIKISQDEMGRLMSYLKGEIDLTDPKERNMYQKVFKDPNMLVSLVDKIMVESAKEPPEKRKRMVIVVLNQVGRYLSQQSTNNSRQKESIQIISALHQALTKNSPTFVAMGQDKNFSQEVDQTIENIKSLVKNQTLVSEYSKYQEKLNSLKQKLNKAAPQLLEFTTDQGGTIKSSELKNTLIQVKNFLEKITQNKIINPADVEQAKTLIALLEKYI
jgi:hypothetical protein